MNTERWVTLVQNYVNSCTSKRPVSHKPCKTLVNMTHWFYLCIKQPTCTYSYTSSHEFLCYVFLSSAFSSWLSPSIVKFHDTVLQCNTSEIPEWPISMHCEIPRLFTAFLPKLQLPHHTCISQYNRHASMMQLNNGIVPDVNLATVFLTKFISWHLCDSYQIPWHFDIFQTSAMW